MTQLATNLIARIMMDPDPNIRVGVDPGATPNPGGGFEHHVTTWYADPVTFGAILLALLLVAIIVGFASRGGDRPRRGGTTIVES